MTWFHYSNSIDLAISSGTVTLFPPHKKIEKKRKKGSRVKCSFGSGKLKIIEQKEIGIICLQYCQPASFERQPVERQLCLHSAGTNRPALCLLEQWKESVAGEGKQEIPPPLNSIAPSKSKPHSPKPRLRTISVKNQNWLMLLFLLFLKSRLCSLPDKWNIAFGLWGTTRCSSLLTAQKCCVGYNVPEANNFTRKDCTWLSCMSLPTYICQVYPHACLPA